MTRRTYSGIWPVAPTPFKNSGELDLEGMGRVLDCMIDQGVDGLCILANFSEQFLISDAEREALTTFSLEHVAGRVPVIVVIGHFALAHVSSTRCAIETPYSSHPQCLTTPRDKVHEISGLVPGRCLTLRWAP